MSLTIKKNHALYVIPVALMALAATSDVALIPFLFILLCVFFKICNTPAFRKSEMIPKLVVILLVFQNFSIGAGAHLTGNVSQKLSLITQVPTMFIVMCYFFMALSAPLKKLDVTFILYVGLCIAYCAYGRGGLVAKLTYLRNFIIFYPAFYIGRRCLNSQAKIRTFIDFILKLATFCTFMGIVGVLAGTAFYKMIGVSEIYIAKRYTSFSENGLPGNFRTLFLGTWVQRIIFPYYEPVNSSYFLALSASLAYASKRKKAFLICVMGLCLTYGKGGMIIFAMLVMCMAVRKSLRGWNEKLARWLIVTTVFTFILLCVYIIHTRFRYEFGTYNHFYGILTGVSGALSQPLGHGIGSAGNLIKTAELAKQDISETGLINLAYQIGIPGTMLFSYLFFALGRQCVRNFQKERRDLLLLCSFFPLALFVVSIFQENAYTPQCIAPYALIIGAMGNYRNQFEVL